MEFISENHVEQAIQAIGTLDSESAVSSFTQKHPALTHYLMTENFEALTKVEQNYMIYLTLVIEHAISIGVGKPPEEIDLELLAQWEEQNWDLFSQQKTKTFRDRVTPFFEDYIQEDLLAFVEDALEDDPEEPIVTVEGRPYIFISLKSLIDTYQEMG